MRNYPRFSEGTLEDGHLPDILLNGESALPPIEKAYSLSVDIGETIVNSTINAIWLVKGEMRFEIKLMECAIINNSHIKQQLAQNPSLLEKISDLFISSTFHRKIVFSKNEEFLKEHELPSNLKPLVDQQAIWSKFMKPFWEKNSFHKMQSSRIDEQGYYILPIYGHYLRLPGEEEELEDEFNAMFAFPKTFSPVVEYGWAYWPLENKKIKLLLWHSDAERRVAEYYGYLEAQETFIRKLKDSEEAEKISTGLVMDYKKKTDAKIKEAFLKALGL